MKKILYLLLAVVAVGCHRVDIYDTDHPTQGKLTLYVDWTNRTADVPVPANYTAESAGVKVTLSGSTVTYPNLLDPGIYTLNLYNTADKITLNGTVVSVATEGNIDINSSVPRSATEGRNIAALPGYQFFGTVTTEIEKDKDHTATVVMQQITRDLHFNLTIAEGDPERIKSVTATLGGIAGAWNCVANTPQGGAVTVMPLFTRTAKNLTASVRLLGTTGASQTLTLNIIFNDGRSQQIVSDITSQLAAFNTNKQQPMTLSGNVNTPTATTQSATITDWTTNDNGEITTELAYKIGDYYPDPYVTFNEDKTVKSGTAPIGIVVDLDNPMNGMSIHGKIMSLKDTSNVAWGPNIQTFAQDPDNGLVNMAKIKGLDDDFSDYPAFQWVHKMNPSTTTYSADTRRVWYFPSRNEGKKIYAAFNGSSSSNENSTARSEFNAKLTAAGGVELKATIIYAGETFLNSLLTSTEEGRYTCISLPIGTGQSQVPGKKANSREFVRAMYAF